jgi:hypothetical protein
MTVRVGGVQALDVGQPAHGVLAKRPDTPHRGRHAEAPRARGAGLEGRTVGSLPN